MGARAAAMIIGLGMVACSGTPKPAPTASSTPTPTPSASASATAAPSATPTATEAPAAGPPKTFAPSATFRELVAAIRAAAPAHVAGECVLGGPSTGPLRIVTYDALPSLGEPPADLDALLERRGGPSGFDPPGIRLTTEWGASEGGDYLDLVALGPAPKALNSTVTSVIIATDKGLYLGLLGRPSDGTRLDGPMQSRIRNELVPRAKIWVVTAEGDAPLSRVREALALVKDTKGTIILATPAASPGPRGKRPSRYDSKLDKSAKHACVANMMDVRGVTPGEYKMKTLSGVSDAIERATKTCGDTLPAGNGGAIHVMMRIGADGRVGPLCAETDDIGDETVRGCVMDSIKKVKIPAPDQKKGLVNFGMPVIFTGKPIHALCDP